MAHGFLKVVRGWVIKHPWTVIILYAFLGVASISYTASRLELKVDQLDLVGERLDFHQHYLEFLEHFADLEFLYVVVEVEGDPNRAIRVVDAIEEELRPLKDRNLVKSVFSRVPMEELGFGLLMLDAGDLREMALFLEKHHSLVASLAEVDSFESLFRVYAELLDPDRLAEFGEGDKLGQDLADSGLKALQAIIRSMGETLGGAGEIAGLENRLADAMGLTLRERGYLATQGERFLLVEILPVKDTTTMELIREPLLAIRAALDNIRDRFPDVSLGLTGRPVLQADEMHTTDQDMRRATVLALVGVFLLFAAFFRRPMRPFLAVVTLAVGVLLTFGLVSVTIGHLTLFSIVFAAMLVGLGIDFGIHFVARYQDELFKGGSVEEAVEITLHTSGSSIATGATTTAAAFFTTLFVDFQGLRELGFIAGSGVLICFLAMVTLLPALLILTDRRATRRGALRVTPPLRLKILESVAARPLAVVLVAAAVTAVGLVSFRGFLFDYNLLDLQARGLESVEYERLLIEQSDTATWYGAFVVDDLEAARDITEKLKKPQEDGIIGQVESLLDVIPKNQQEKLALLEKSWQSVRDIQFAPAAREIDREGLLEAAGEVLQRLDEVTDLLARRADPPEREAIARVSDLADRLDRWIATFEGSPEAARERLATLQKRWFSEYRELAAKLHSALRFGPLEPEKLPPILRTRYLSWDGSQQLVYAYPTKNLWDEENLAEFVNTMREIDPGANGTPIHFYESAETMLQGFERAAIYSLVVVCILLLVDLRSVGRTLLAMVPLIVGLVWLVELQPVTGLSFNLANFFAVPILIGCGIDGGVHLVHRFYQSRSRVEVTRTTSTAVTVSFLTTAVGFGTMGIARHRGVASLGLMMVVGLASILIASVVLLPALLEMVQRRAGRRVSR